MAKIEKVDFLDARNLNNGVEEPPTVRRGRVSTNVAEADIPDAASSADPDDYVLVRITKDAAPDWEYRGMGVVCTVQDTGDDRPHYTGKVERVTTTNEVTHVSGHKYRRVYIVVTETA